MESGETRGCVLRAGQHDGSGRGLWDIDDYAFEGCGKLGSITLGWPKLSWHSLEGIRKKAHIYVQCAKAEYKNLKKEIQKSGAKKPIVKWVEDF